MFSRKAMVIKALCVLEEVKQQSRQGRVPPSFGLRFALAYLYQVGDRRDEHFDREPYDEFWRIATQSDEACDGADSSAAAYGRQIHLRAAMNGIARAAGYDLDVENDHRMRAVMRERS